VYSSPLQRAVQTAAILAEGLPHATVTLEPDVREIGCGNVDGWPIDRVQERFPCEWATNLRQVDPDFRWPGGESYRELRARVLASFQRMARCYPAQRVVVVTHAGVISQLIGWLRGESPARWEAFRPRNASVTELLWQGERTELVRFDDCGRSDSIDGSAPGGCPARR
jgi:broad specificity phosphatase PhoE